MTMKVTPDLQIPGKGRSMTAKVTQIKPVITGGPDETRFIGSYTSSGIEENDPDLLSLYLKQIARYPLLNAEDERNLGIEMEMHTQNINEFKKQLSAGKINFKEYAFGVGKEEERLKRCKNRMINSNLRLVVSIAKKYQHRGMNLLDLIDEGNIGLIEAVERFDFEKGYRFSTYGTWWIRQSIIKSLADKGRVIRIPIHMLNSIRKVFYTAKQMTQDFGRDPTSLELAEYLAMPQDKVEEIMRLSQDTASLDITVDEDNVTKLSDLLCDDHTAAPFDVVFNLTLQGTLDKVLGQLKDREQRIIKLRFGLVGEGPCTLEKTGQILGLTRERVRQIQEKALQKLRKSVEIKELSDVV
jgi:RNA polymerase primary sigma factor